MWKSIVYKEWLKIRWFLIAFTGLGILAIGNIFLSVQHDFTFNEANNYWYNIIFRGVKYFGNFKYIPIAGALVIAIAQYFPETVNKRIKLTYHLPINENKALIQMMLFGAFCLFATYILLFFMFLGFSSFYFPKEIIMEAITTILPWFLAGFTAYFLVALIVLEPAWKFRFLYFLVAAAFVPLFFESAKIGGFAPINPVLVILALIVSISLLFSGYRFRKGEM